MKKKIICIIFASMFILTSFSVINAEELSEIKQSNNDMPEGVEKVEYQFDQASLSTADNPDTSCYPNENTPISVYGKDFFGKEWDSQRGAWRYRWRFDWYQAKRGEPYGDSGFDEDPYVVLEVDLSITETGIVSEAETGGQFGGGAEGYRSPRYSVRDARQHRLGLVREEGGGSLGPQRRGGRTVSVCLAVFLSANHLHRPDRGRGRARILRVEGVQGQSGSDVAGGPD
jgi:hypothetical protein